MLPEISIFCFFILIRSVFIFCLNDIILNDYDFILIKSAVHNTFNDVRFGFGTSIYAHILLCSIVLIWELRNHCLEFILWKKKIRDRF